MLPLTRHGWREMLLGSVVLAAIGVGLDTLWRPLSLLVIPLLIWLFAFFRDPERTIPGDPHTMLSPADGTVADITELEEFSPLQGPVVRIGIFLSVFNVHVNRSPCDGKVVGTQYKRGKFINAMHHEEASRDNESNLLILGDASSGRPIAAVKQISGMIARRIVCTARLGDVLQRGQRIGMIKFGSRTELYIPKWLQPKIRVSVGQKVQGAADILARLSPPVEAAVATERQTVQSSAGVLSQETPA